MDEPINRCVHPGHQSDQCRCLDHGASFRSNTDMFYTDESFLWADRSIRPNTPHSLGLGLGGHMTQLILIKLIKLIKPFTYQILCDDKSSRAERRKRAASFPEILISSNASLASLLTRLTLLSSSTNSLQAHWLPLTYPSCQRLTVQREEHTPPSQLLIRMIGLRGDQWTERSPLQVRGLTLLRLHQLPACSLPVFTVWRSVKSDWN